MDNTNKLMYLLNDKAILQLLGEFIKSKRIEQNITQQNLAIAAGINRSTIVQLENGGGANLLSFLQILRALNILDMLDGFKVEQQLSPIQLSKIKYNTRERASTISMVSEPISKW